VLIGLSSVLLFSKLHKGGLSGYDDALYAHEGKQMLLTGDWWNVVNNGLPNFEYPPMFIWLEALSMKMWGISDFAAKFPAALSGLLCIVLVFSVVRILSDDFWLPVLAAWVLMLSQYFVKYSTHAMTDVPFTFFFTLSIYSYVRGMRQRAYLVLCGVAIGCGILTRSILGLIPAGIILGHLLLMKRHEIFRSGYFWIGLFVALSAPSIWYVSQYQLHGDPFLARHFSFIASKIFSQDDSSSGTAFLRGLIEYPWLLLRLYWPWLPFMVFGMGLQCRKMIRSRDNLATLLVLWVVLVLVPFSLVEVKILRYIMPIFPAFSILAAMPLRRNLSPVRKYASVKMGYIVLCAFILLIAAVSTPRARAEEMKALAPIVDSNTDSKQRVAIYTFGEWRHDYVNQFLWYSDRFCELLTTPQQVKQWLRDRRAKVFIVDRASYQEHVQTSGVQLRVLVSTKQFVCFEIIEQ
jgi:4-amino-4-deoxy-L-arabinose transferase-like glycosyltransferase